MAFVKYGKAVITKPVTSLPGWETKKAGFEADPKSFIDISEYPVDKFLFTQATILGSVDLESNGYYIKPGYESLVNMNGDCWTNKVSMATHGTFRGAYNFLNHVQIPEQSKGTVIDTAPRRIIFPDGRESVYVDILVATARKHASLCSDIERGALNTMSLGAIVKFSVCSKCGKVAKTGNDYCRHLLDERRGMFSDSNGQRRIIAEICGREDVDDSNIFIEASWVYEPAFYGAVRSRTLSPSLDKEPKQGMTIVSVNKRANLEDSVSSSDFYYSSIRTARKLR